MYVLPKLRIGANQGSKNWGGDKNGLPQNAVSCQWTQKNALASIYVKKVFITAALRRSVYIERWNDWIFEKPLLNETKLRRKSIRRLWKILSLEMVFLLSCHGVLRWAMSMIFTAFLLRSKRWIRNFIMKCVSFVLLGSTVKNIYSCGTFI